jgi:hypothetical protein
LKELSASED